MDSSELKHLEELREAHQRRLRSLELKAATYGLDTPPQIAIEITEIRARVVQLGQQTAVIRPPLPPQPHPAVDPLVARGIRLTLDDNFQYSRPFRFALLNQTYDYVATWRQVYGLSCQQLAQRNPDQFAKLTTNPTFIGKQGTRYFSQTAADLRSPQLVASGVYIESNLAANTIRDQIKKLLTEFQIERSSFSVDVRREKDAAQMQT